MRGRALSAIRPGQVIKDELLARSEATVAELHRYYVEQLAMRLPLTKPARKRPRFYMRYSSFARYFHWFKQLGLVERVLLPDGSIKTTPASYPQLRDEVYYKLTPAGIADAVSWLDPLKAVHPGLLTGKGHKR